MIVPVAVRGAIAFGDWPPCGDCHHGPHEPGQCPVITGSSGGPMPEPEYCGCDPRTIDHFCSRCFGEIRAGETRVLVGSGPDGEETILCGPCAKQGQLCGVLVYADPCTRPPGHPGYHSRVGCSQGC